MPCKAGQPAKRTRVGERRGAELRLDVLIAPLIVDQQNLQPLQQEIGNMMQRLRSRAPDSRGRAWGVAARAPPPPRRQPCQRHAAAPAHLPLTGLLRCAPASRDGRWRQPVQRASSAAFREPPAQAAYLREAHDPTIVAARWSQAPTHTQGP